MPLGICLHSFTIINFLRYMNPVMTTGLPWFSNSASRLPFRLAFMYSTNGSCFFLFVFIALLLLYRFHERKDTKRIHFTSLSSQGYFLFGFLGNQPFCTRSSCSKISLIVQNDEKANTPQIADTNTLSINREAITPKIPKTRNIHQHFVPQ